MAIAGEAVPLEVSGGVTHRHASPPTPPPAPTSSRSGPSPTRPRSSTSPSTWTEDRRADAAHHRRRQHPDRRRPLRPATRRTRSRPHRPLADRHGGRADVRRARPPAPAVPRLARRHARRAASTGDRHLVGGPAASPRPCATCPSGTSASRRCVIEPGVRTGMPILYENPKEVGADRIANAVAAYDLYGGPSIVVDFGTATTLDAISAKGEYLGGAIVPGIEVSMDALFGRAAGLRKVELVPPRNVIGKSTVESIQSGAVYGFTGQVDHLVELLRAEELGESTVIATGGLASLISPLSHARSSTRSPGSRSTVCGSCSSGTDERSPRSRNPRAVDAREDEYAAPPRRGRSHPGRAAVDPYPVRFDRRPHGAAPLHDGVRRAEPGHRDGHDRAAVGRPRHARSAARASWPSSPCGTATAAIQLFVSRARSATRASPRSPQLDLGDWVGVEGEVMTTRRGELSVTVDGLRTLLAKAAPAPARQVARPLRRRHPLPPALRRPHRQRGRPPGRSRSASPRSPRIRRILTAGASSRSRRPVLQPRRAGRRPGPSSPTTTPSTWTCTCASPPSCT